MKSNYYYRTDVNQHNSTSRRLKLLALMQEQEISVYTRLSITRHISKLEKEQGDKMVEELISIIENGAREKEIIQIAEDKYKVKMLIEEH